LHTGILALLGKDYSFEKSEKQIKLALTSTPKSGKNRVAEQEVDPLRKSVE